MENGKKFMRVSEERQAARIRVSQLRVAFADAICDAPKELTYAEINLAIAQAQQEWADRAFCLETEKSMKRANK